MSDCIFCKIVAGEIPAEKVFEDDDVLAFADIQPAAPVHILIIPKRHIATIADADEEDAELLGKLILTAKKIAAEQGLSGYKLNFNVGKDGGQVVFHVHLHLLGGWEK